MEMDLQEIKARLCGDSVMIPYNPARDTRVYSDSEPEETKAALAQLYYHPEKGVTWRPVHHTARAWTTVEKGYSQMRRRA